MRRPKNTGWQFFNGYDPKYEKMPDPRLAVTIQLAWRVPTIHGMPNHTLNPFPEPDNYTHAIWYKKPLFIEGIDHQCWYRDRARGGWMSLYVVDDLTKPLLATYIMENEIWGLWTNATIKPQRKLISRLDYEKRICWGDHHGDALEERLYDMGVYDDLVYKGATPNFIEHHSGRLNRENVV